MKYFTPDLIARGQNEDSRDLNEVEALWDERCVQYNAYLGSIRNELSSGLRHITDSYYLHDASVQAMGHRRDQLVLVLKLDTPPRSLLTFTYHLLEQPRINRHILYPHLPPAMRSGASVVDWLYDEIEKVPGEPLTWRQLILLSNGWEVVIHFRDVEVAEMQVLLPVPTHGTAPWTPACLP
jgi:hypothetical protein